MTATKVKLAWAAGLIDGEGCISLTRRSPQRTNGAVNPNYRLILKVTMCHEGTVRALLDLFKVGTIHAQAQQQSYWTKAWIWHCNAEDAEKVLQQIKPYMLTKLEEAEVALDFLAQTDRNRAGKARKLTPEDVARREIFFCRLRDLKTCNQSKAKKEIYQATLGKHHN